MIIFIRGFSFMFFSDVAYRPSGSVESRFVSPLSVFRFLLMATPMVSSRVPRASNKETLCRLSCLSLLWRLLVTWWARPHELGFFLNFSLDVRIGFYLQFHIFCLLMILSCFARLIWDIFFICGPSLYGLRRRWGCGLISINLFWFQSVMCLICESWPIS